MRSFRPLCRPSAQLLRASLLALAVTGIGALPLLGQAKGPDSGPLPTVLAQANPFGPKGISFSITAPPSITIETPAPGVASGEGASGTAPTTGTATAGVPAQSESPSVAAAEATPKAAPPGTAAAGSEMVGYASWYGTKFQGRLTANGEIYDMYQLTAANRTLPFGTLVRVTNLDNSKSVVVRINDRGPFVDGRIIDLSKAAAEIIGMPGIAKVRLHVVGASTAVDFAPMQRSELAAARLSVPAEVAPAVARDSAPAGAAARPPMGQAGGGSATPPSFPSRLTLQVGAFRDADNVARLERLLTANGFSPRAEHVGGLTRVLIPQVETAELASTKKRLASLGITSILVRTE